MRYDGEFRLFKQNGRLLRYTTYFNCLYGNFDDKTAVNLYTV